MGFNLAAVICKYKTKIPTRIWLPPQYMKEQVFKLRQGTYIHVPPTPSPKKKGLNNQLPTLRA